MKYNFIKNISLAIVSFRWWRYRMATLFISDSAYSAWKYERKFGKKLNLENPQSFNEKILWLKLFYRNEILTQCADKYAARSFVESRVGSEILNDLYGVYDRAEDIDFASLPNSFVLKVNHGWRQNILCKDKASLDWDYSKSQLRRWLCQNQYYQGREWSYKNIPPKIICEKYLEENGKPPLECQFYCFNGVPIFLEAHSDRFTDHLKNTYDMYWNVPAYRRGEDQKGLHSFERPLHLERMIEYATQLSQGFPFVRIDFFHVNNKVFFCEMTFYPSNGSKEFYPAEYNRILGSFIQLP